jgi:hypothetical protein
MCAVAMESPSSPPPPPAPKSCCPQRKKAAKRKPAAKKPVVSPDKAAGAGAGRGGGEASSALPPLPLPKGVVESLDATVVYTPVDSEVPVRVGTLLACQGWPALLGSRVNKVARGG